MNKILLIMGLAVLLFSCSSGNDNRNIATEIAIGQSIEMEWGKCTLTIIDGSTCLLLDVNIWPKDAMLSVPGIKTKVKNVHLKSNPKHHFAWRFVKGELQVHIPSSLKSTSAVIVVEIKGEAQLISGNQT